MSLTRAQNQPGADGILGTADDIQNANNTDSPWVDQSQTYTSHASHQVFLREYKSRGRQARRDRQAARRPRLPARPTPARPDGTDRHRDVEGHQDAGRHAPGLRLEDKDVLNIPMLATDPYGEFIPGPNGFPQYVTCRRGLARRRPGRQRRHRRAGAERTPCLLRHAVPDRHRAQRRPVAAGHGPHPDPPVAPTPDTDNTPSADFAHQPAGTYDDEMLNAHFICGDGRCNENIALSFIHQIFHSEHDRLAADIDNTLHQPGNEALLAGYTSTTPVDGAGPNARVWSYGDRLFQAARFVTEMEYQHLVFEEFARKMVPAIHPFHVYSPGRQPGDRGRVRARGLPVRSLDARRRRRPLEPDREARQPGHPAGG